MDDLDDDGKTIVTHRDAAGGIVLRIVCPTPESARMVVETLTESFKEPDGFFAGHTAAVDA